jgi:hypothetical protein
MVSLSVVAAKRLVVFVRVAARIYIETQPRLSAPQVRTIIERLYQLNTRTERAVIERRALLRASRRSFNNIIQSA